MPSNKLVYDRKMSHNITSNVAVKGPTMDITHFWPKARLPIKLLLSCVEIFVAQSQRYVLEYMTIYSRSDSDELIMSLINGC